MTRVVVVADSGSDLARLTNAVGSIAGAYIARHVSGRARLDRLVARLDPDLVVVGELHVPGDAPARVAEVRSAAPGARIVVISSSSDNGGLEAALRTVLAEPDGAAPGPAGTPLRLIPHTAEERRHRRRRRVRHQQTSHGGAAA